MQYLQTLEQTIQRSKKNTGGAIGKHNMIHILQCGELTYHEVLNWFLTGSVLNFRETELRYGEGWTMYVYEKLLHLSRM